MLNRETSGAVDVRYDRNWLAWESTFPISLSLPLREDRYIGAPVINVFGNLLPDSEPIRRRVAEVDRLHIHGVNVAGRFTAEAAFRKGFIAQPHIFARELLCRSQENEQCVRLLCLLQSPRKSDPSRQSRIRPSKPVSLCSQRCQQGGEVASTADTERLFFRPVGFMRGGFRHCAKHDRAARQASPFARQESCPN
ncbi:HipA N-terminal domain-containing protein [Bradyrhizobium sp. UFLA01-814]|uniref:HipA N-terminal domain-containing protein n=1 Tax=Bradyrhizobium sp. UFLA01-814 TaxID=3023480 RepID=UPI00398B4924